MKVLADALGARVVGTLPKTGGGAFGAARLVKAVTELQEKPAPSRGKRLGRPTIAAWSLRPKVPMSRATKRRLVELARNLPSRGDH